MARSLGMRKDSKLPKEELEFVQIKLLEWARGKFDMKETDIEMMNRNRIKVLGKYSVVTDGLIKVFPERTEIYKWLSENAKKMAALRRGIALHLI